jgi:hypothetical protein
MLTKEYLCQKTAQNIAKIEEDKKRKIQEEQERQLRADENHRLWCIKHLQEKITEAVNEAVNRGEYSCEVVIWEMKEDLHKTIMDFCKDLQPALIENMIPAYTLGHENGESVMLRDGLEKEVRLRLQWKN